MSIDVSIIASSSPQDWALNSLIRRRQDTSKRLKPLPQRLRVISQKTTLFLKTVSSLILQFGRRALIWNQRHEQDRQWCNNETRSCNHCCRKKATSITHSQCVCSLSYQTRKAHAPYYIAICGMSDYYSFPHYHKRHAFQGKLNEQKMIDFIFSTTFLFSRRIRQDII
jgi:hypothetical protein